MEVNFRILGILFVYVMDICFRFEIFILREVFGKWVIYSVNFFVVCIKKFYLFRFENLYVYLNVNDCCLEF